MPIFLRQLAFGIATCAISFSCLAAGPDTAPQPTFKPGDSWVFDQVEQKGQTGFAQMRLDMTVEETGDDTMTLGLKRDGAPTGNEDQVIGTDWSHRRLIDGQQTITTRPFEFPLRVGRSWTVDFTDPIRRGNQLTNHVHEVYLVLGWKEIDVPAGHFRAIEVEGHGVMEGTLLVPAVAGSIIAATPGSATGISHAQAGGTAKLVRVTHTELYYVPSVKTYAKSVEEQYTPDNVRVSRKTQTLVRFKSAS